MYKDEEKKYQEEVVAINRVTKVTSGGRQLRFQAIVVVGDQKGQVGIATGKATEVMVAVTKASEQAKKNLIKLDISLGTIPHPIKSKYKASKIILIPAAPGTGIIAGGVVRKILVLAGYRNILSKIQGSSNKLNNAKATMKALELLKDVQEGDYRFEEAGKELEMIEEQRKRDEEKKKRQQDEKKKEKDRGRKDNRNKYKKTYEKREKVETKS